MCTQEGGLFAFTFSHTVGVHYGGSKSSKGNYRKMLVNARYTHTVRLSRSLSDDPTEFLSCDLPKIENEYLCTLYSSSDSVNKTIKSFSISCLKLLQYRSHSKSPCDVLVSKGQVYFSIRSSGKHCSTDISR